MNVKKPVAIIGIIILVAGLTLASARIIDWRLFWFLAIIVAGLSWLVGRKKD